MEVRRRIGMVFQKPNPFPKSVFENVAFGLRINGFRGNLRERVEEALRQAALWDEVKHDLHRKTGYDLSGGQQQAARVSDRTASMVLGELVEFGPTREVFTRPKDGRTEAYITGRFG